MSEPRNNGNLVLKLGLVLAALGGVAFFILHNLQGTARVKPVNRDMAVDAVTGSVVVQADGGFK
jgi:hypothetical protein